MPDVSEDTLARMARLLKTGPIVIGEEHDKGAARKAIIRLIARNAVSYVSLESPIGPENMTHSDGQLKETSKYLGAVTSMANAEVSFENLVRYAKGHSVKVYFHDVPAKSSPLNYAGETDPALKPNGPYTTYPTYAKRYLPNLPNTRMKDDLPLAKAAANLYRHRNHYAANFLREKLGNGVRVLFGLVVLAGSYHVRADKSGDHTIQACLGIDSSRAFICV
jgi:hypothetical protein